MSSGKRQPDLCSDALIRLWRKLKVPHSPQSPLPEHQGMDRKSKDKGSLKQLMSPLYTRSVTNACPTPGNIQGRSQTPSQMRSQSQWPTSGAVYGPSKSGLQPPRGIGPQFTRSALQATTMQQEAYGQQYSLANPALSPVGMPARSGHSTASFSFRGQHSHVSDGSLTDSTSSSTTSSGHCCGCNVTSDADLIPPRSKRRLARSGDVERGKNFSWITCAPVVGGTLLVASMLLFGISTLVRSHRVAFSLAVTQHMQEAANPQHEEGTSPAEASTNDSYVQNKLFTEERKSEDTWKTDLTTTTEGTTVPTTTPAPTIKAKTMAPGLKRKHTKRAIKTAPSLKRASRKSKGSGRKASKKRQAILLRQAILPECSYAFYTFCRRAQHEYFYQPDTNTCHESDGVNVCTRGRNRFATLEHCVHSCVSTNRPAEECFGKPMFTQCARRDVLSHWWYYDHSKCVPWSFPSGGCPANGSMVFATAKECEQRCRDPHNGPRCKRPGFVACVHHHLKYPYFAHVSSVDGRMRCYRSSLATLRRHQCLVGENRFPNFGTCAVTCRQKRPPY